MILGACAAPGGSDARASATAHREPSPVPPLASEAAASPIPDGAVIIYGWFSIVWNESAHYFIIDDEGRAFEVLFDESLVLPAGGPLSLDRARVRVSAIASADEPTLLRALSIERVVEE